jgi:LuxR family quorum-sensing system transcriptional regulator CciR
MDGRCVLEVAMNASVMDKAWGYFENLFKADEQDELIASLQGVLNFFSVECFAYLGLNFGTGHAHPILISTYPQEWCDHYLEKLYYSFDPVIQGARENILPFEWGSPDYRNKLSKTQKLFFNEATEFGIASGLTFPMHGVQNQLSSMSMAWSSDPLLDLYSKNMLQLAAMHFHVRQVEMIRCDLGSSAENAKLSPRETECLTWVANGKSSWEIGMILSLSEHTVREYLGNAMRKLNCSSREQAIVTAVMKGLITP